MTDGLRETFEQGHGWVAFETGPAAGQGGSGVVTEMSPGCGTTPTNPHQPVVLAVSLPCGAYLRCVGRTSSNVGGVLMIVLDLRKAVIRDWISAG